MNHFVYKTLHEAAQLRYEAALGMQNWLPLYIVDVRNELIVQTIHHVKFAVGPAVQLLPRVALAALDSFFFTD